MIHVVVNGKPRPLDGEMGLAQFLEAHKIEPKLIAIEYNGLILDRDRYAEVTLRDGDRLEIVHMIGGG